MTALGRRANSVRRRARSLIAAAVGVAVIAGVSACASDPAQGYTARSTIPARVRTVSIPVFDNQTFVPGLEVDLTDALIKEIQRTTPLVVVQGGGAESVLSGTITQADLRELTTSGRTGLVQEVGQQLAVDFTWLDARSGRPLSQVRGLQALESFVPQRGVGERVETARQQAAQELARRIVAQLHDQW